MDAERPGSRRRGLAILAVGVVIGSGALVLLWPGEDDVIVESGSFKPEKPADYVFSLRRKVAPLPALVTRKPTPTTTTR